MIAGYSNCDTFPLTALGSLQTFALLPPVLNQSFTNGSNADLAPKCIGPHISIATRLLSSIYLNNCLCHSFSTSIIDQCICKPNPKYLESAISGNEAINRDLINSEYLLMHTY